MSRESLDALEIFPLVDGNEGDDVAARLTALEHAYRDLLSRLDCYEQERREIRARLGGVLSRLATLKAP